MIDREKAMARFLAATLFGFLFVGFWLGVFYVLIHFIVKFW